MIRNEADIIRYTVGRLLEQVDQVVVCDHGSTDGTTDILHELGVTVIDGSGETFRQGQIITDLASRAEIGEWVVPFDGDEYWSNLNLLADLDADIATVRPFVHVPHPDDLPNPDPCRRIVHRQPRPEPQPKVAFRWQQGVAVDEGNHRIFGGSRRQAEPGLDVRHFQFRSFEQATRKVRAGAAALDAAGIHPLYGSHWRNLAQLDHEALLTWWDEYMAKPTVIDPAPQALCPR